jgi:hypothetical protein
VFALVARNGELYVGGSFLQAGGVATNHIARYTPETSTFSDLGTGMEGSGYYTYVSSLAIDSTGRLYAGGIFPRAGGVPLHNLAMYENGRWSEIGGGTDNSVYDIAVGSAGEIYIGGEFRRVGGQRMEFIARWNGRWDSLGIGVDRPVNALATYRNFLFAGGAFILAGPNVANGVARWDGTFWRTMGSGITGSFTNGVVYALAVDDSAIHVGGEFALAGRKPSASFASWYGPLTSGVRDVERRSPPGTIAIVSPNPLQDHATIAFTLEEPSRVRLSLVDELGRTRLRIADELMNAGSHGVPFTRDELEAGAYLYHLEIDGRTSSGVVVIQ